MNYVVIKGQSLVDACIQVYGSLERLAEFAAINGLTPTSPIMPGQVLQHNAGGNASARLLADSARTVATENLGGIGATIIHLDFIIE